jgi:hypothetical protein
MAEVDDRDVVFLLDLFNLSDHHRYLAAWHHNILVELVGIDIPQ